MKINRKTKESTRIECDVSVLVYVASMIRCTRIALLGDLEAVHGFDGNIHPRSLGQKN